MIAGLTVRELLLCVPFFVLAAVGAVLVDGGPIADIGLTLAAGIAAGGAIALSRHRSSG